jgi:hypothetical protein
VQPLRVCLSSLDAQGGRETACLPRPRAQTCLLQGLSHSVFHSPSPPLAQAYRGDVLSCIADMDMHTGCGELAFCPALGLLAVVTVASGELLTLSTSTSTRPHQASRLTVAKNNYQHTAHSTRDRCSRVWHIQQRAESCLRACIARVVPAATNTGKTPGATPALLFLRRLHYGGSCS